MLQPTTAVAAYSMCVQCIHKYWHSWLLRLVVPVRVCSKQPEVPKMTMRRMQLYIHVFLTTEWLQIPEACVCARECYSRFSSEYLYVRGRESKFSVYSVKSGYESVCSVFFVSLLVCIALTSVWTCPCMVFVSGCECARVFVRLLCECKRAYML